MPRGVPKKKFDEMMDTQAPESSDEKVNKLLEVVEQERTARKAAEDELEASKKKELKAKDPMSGPGVLCQVIKITKSEAWQLKSQERTNPLTRTEEMMTDPVPEGYADRLGPNNCHYVVKPEHVDPKFPLDEAVIPNCRSKYTQEVTVFGPKPAVDKGDFKKDPPKVKLHLCEKHKEMFGAWKWGTKTGEK